MITEILLLHCTESLGSYLVYFIFLKGEVRTAIGSISPLADFYTSILYKLNFF